MLVTFALSVITGLANSFVSPLRGGCRAPAGMGDRPHGRLPPAWWDCPRCWPGRWLADHVGRRPTCSVAMVTIAVWAARSGLFGPTAGAAGGYVLGVSAAVR